MKKYVILLALASCTGTEHLPPAPTHADSLLASAGMPSVRKLVIRGPVTVQVAAPGSTQTLSAANDNRKAGQRQGSAATAPAAQASNASKAAGAPWWVWIIGGLVVFAAGFVVRSRLKLPLPV